MTTASLPELDGFHKPVLVGDDDLKLPVYQSTVGEKPIVVLHELPGMTPGFIAYCRRMMQYGFKVHAPLIFGQPEETKSPLAMISFCLSREFRALFRREDGDAAPTGFSKWLREFTEQVASENGGKKIGVIGMCLTGGFSLVGFAVPDVAAVMCCQPAFPFLFNKETLGMTNDERLVASENAARLPAPCAKGYRYRWDVISRPSHMKAIKETFEDAFVECPAVPGFGHSTVTSSPPNEAVFQDIVQFLNARLS